jgi:hypothetical protein
VRQVGSCARERTASREEFCRSRRALGHGRNDGFTLFPLVDHFHRQKRNATEELGREAKVADAATVT